MTPLSAATICAAQDAVAKYGSMRAAARATGIPYGTLHGHIAAGKKHNAKPRYKVPARVTGDEPPHFTDAPQPRPAPLYSEPAPSSPATDTITRVAVLGDCHDDPHISKERFTWLGRFIVDMAPDRIVQIGDIADMESLSFHASNDTEAGRYKPRFVADMDSLREAMDLLTAPIEQANIKARRDITLGNHEHRIWRFEDSAPETSGLLQTQFASVLGNRGWTYHKYGKFLEIAGVDFVHIPLSKMTKPLSKPAIARQATRDCVFGHTHAESVVTIEKNNNQKIKLIDVGSAMPDGFIGGYARDTATAPWWGAWLLTIRNGRIEGHTATPMFELKRRYS